MFVISVLGTQKPEDLWGLLVRQPSLLCKFRRIRDPVSTNKVQGSRKKLKGSLWLSFIYIYMCTHIPGLDN